MNVKIKYIKDSGDIKNERLVIQILKDDDIGYYLVFDTTFTKDGNISNTVRHAYWFPDKNVSAGDIVVLYTKGGRQSEKVNKDGSTSHFFYRNMERTVWNKDGDCAVVLHINNWIVKGV